MSLLFAHIKLKLITVSPKTLGKGVKNSGYEIGDFATEWEGSSKEEDSDFDEMFVDDGVFEEGLDDSKEWTKGYEMDVDLRETMV